MRSACRPAPHSNPLLLHSAQLRPMPEVLVLPGGPLKVQGLYFFHHNAGDATLARFLRVLRTRGAFQRPRSVLSKQYVSAVSYQTPQTAPIPQL